MKSLRPASRHRPEPHPLEATTVWKEYRKAKEEQRSREARARRKKIAVIALAVLAGSAFAIVLLPPQPNIQPGALEITAIDVGQGDSLLIVSPQGRTMLIDGGGSIGPVHG